MIDSVITSASTGDEWVTITANSFGGDVSVPFQSPMAEGWLCPRCKRVNSPMMMQCNCPAQATSQPATTGSILANPSSVTCKGDVQITLT
jgi:hypothetical protein